MSNPILTAEQARVQVPSTLGDSDLQVLLDREAHALLARFGPPGDGTTAITEAQTGGTHNVYLARPVVSVSSVVERQLGSADQAVAASQYEVWEAEGRIERVSGRWRARVTVTYIPVDQRPQYQAALIDLLRLTLERKALKSESIAGEYSYTAPEWQAERTQVYRDHRLMFQGV